MLTPSRFADAWRHFARERGLSATQDAGADGALRSLAMSGAVDGVAVELTYRVVRELREQDLLPLVSQPTVREVVSHVLVAKGSTPRAISGAISVGLDPAPTYRKVASLLGGGDPTVGDKPFDDRFLLEGNEAELRAVLTDEVRAGLKALAQIPTGMRLTVKGASVVLECPTVLRGPETLAAVLATLVAAGR